MDTPAIRDGKLLNYWIFQSNPKRFDLENAIKELKKDTFTINQYRNDIKEGDNILFWISGNNASIIGYGKVLTNPEISKANEKAKKFQKDKNLDAENWRVWVSYHPIENKVLKSDLISTYSNIFSNISIIKQSQGTNFPIDKTIWEFIHENFIQNYFIFIFNEKFYEDERSLGRIFKFPELDRGGYKYIGKSPGSWGAIIEKIKVRDKVIWTISGKSKRKDKKTFWGRGEIVEVDNDIRIWKLGSYKFNKKIKVDEIIRKLPDEYQKLYFHSTGKINLGYFGVIQIDIYQYDFFMEEINKLGKREFDIIVMNISPENVEYCIKNTIQGVNNKNKILINIAKNLRKGDICIIRQTSGGGRYKYGVLGIWYFLEREDMEEKIEPNWVEKTGWKYKIHMKPLIHEFKAIFEEDFSKNVPGQLRQKESSKVSGLTQTQLQGAIKRFKDKTLAQKYLRAIIEEKKTDCDIEVEYENTTSKKRLNVYNFLNDLTKDIYDEDLNDLLNFEKIWHEIKNNLKPNTIIYTLKKRKPNKVVQILDTGILVQTDKEPKLIKIDLMKTAWHNFVKDEILYQAEHEKSTHRSSFILPLFSILNFVEASHETPIHIRLNKEKLKKGSKPKIDQYWTCPKDSCDHKKIKLVRNENNIINTPSYGEIIIHFLQHLKEENIYFGSIDIQKIFLAFSPDNVLSKEDKGKYADLGTIWKNRIRSALSGFTRKGYFKTSDKSEIPLLYNLDVKNKRDFRTRKRTMVFLEDYELFDDWELYSIPKTKEYKKIELQLIDALPFPLASILWAYKADINLEHKVDRLFHFFEALSQFISIILLSGFATDKKFFNKECKIGSNFDLQWYKRPTFSSWNQICMWLAKSIRRIMDDRKKFKTLKSLFGNPSNDFFVAITNKKLFRILEDVREYRNIWKGHGGIVSVKETKKRLTALEDQIILIENLLSKVFNKLLLIFPLSSEYIKKIHNYRVKVIMGTRRPFRETVMKTKVPMEKGMLYILSERQMTPIELLPLIRLMESPRMEQEVCYFYNRYDRDNVRWISYHFETEAEIYNTINEIKPLFDLFKERNN